MSWRGLAALRALQAGPLLTRQLAAELGISADSALSVCRVLRGRGYLASTEGVHQLTLAGREALERGEEITSGAAPHRPDSLRSKAWRVMRMRDGFGLEDLLDLLCSGAEGDPERNLGGYVRALEIAGYLLRLRRGAAPRWRLRRERDTGPDAPSWNKKARTVTDPNTGEVHHLPRAGSGHVA